MATNSGGLLDFVNTPMGMGLLSAAFGGLAGARRGAPLNSVGAAGLAGMAGYNAATNNGIKLRAEELQRLQRMELPSLYTTDANGNTSFDFKRGAELGIAPEDMVKYSQLPNASRAKVARTLEIPGINGTKQTIQLDEFGNRVGEGIDSYVKPEMVDLGGSKQFVLPTAGQSYAVSMSPAEQAANARGWANVGISRDRNQVMREQNQVMRDLNIQEKQLKLDDLQSKRADRKRSMDAQRASISSQIDVIDKALNHPGRESATGLSGSLDPRNYVPGTDARNFQVLLDQIGGSAFLQAFESLKGGGQITEIEGKKATDAIARLNRAQSDSEFKQSLQDLREVMSRGQQRLLQSQGNEMMRPLSAQQPIMSQQPQQPAQKSITRTGTVNGRKVVQYSDGSIDYAD